MGNFPVEWKALAGVIIEDFKDVGQAALSKIVQLVDYCQVVLTPYREDSVKLMYIGS